MLVRVEKFKRTYLGEKTYVSNPATCTFKNSIYLENITDSLDISCDVIIEVTKTIPTKTVPKKANLSKFDASSTEESKDIPKKYEELWTKIRDLIRSKTNNSDNYDEKYMKIKLNSDDNLPLFLLLF